MGRRGIERWSARCTECGGKGAPRSKSRDRAAVSTPPTARKYSHSSRVRLTMASLGLLSQDGRLLCLEDGGAGLLALMVAQVRIATEKPSHLRTSGVNCSHGTHFATIGARPFLIVVYLVSHLPVRPPFTNALLCGRKQQWWVVGTTCQKQ
jgi:hypothetical protein